MYLQQGSYTPSEKHLPEITFPQKHLAETTLPRIYISLKVHFPQITFL